MQQIGGWGGGPLCVHVRPRTPEQHRHTPSLRGGDAEERQRRKKQSGTEGKRGRERQRMTGRERGGGREWEAC